jgi:hypothetical protein
VTLHKSKVEGVLAAVTEVQRVLSLVAEAVEMMAVMGKVTTLLGAAAEFASFGPALHVSSPQLIQVTCNGTLYSY